MVFHYTICIFLICVLNVINLFSMKIYKLYILSLFTISNKKPLLYNLLLEIDLCESVVKTDSVNSS